MYINKFTHYAIGGVAALYLRTQGSPPLQRISAVWSCCFRLALTGRPLRLQASSLFFYAAMRAMVQELPRPPGSSPRPCSLRAGQAGLRFNVLLGGLGLAGGFQRAVQVDFVATTELSLALAFFEKCLLD